LASCAFRTASKYAISAGLNVDGGAAIEAGRTVGASVGGGVVGSLSAAVDDGSGALAVVEAAVDGAADVATIEVVVAGSTVPWVTETTVEDAVVPMVAAEVATARFDVETVVSRLLSALATKSAATLPTMANAVRGLRRFPLVTAAL
jgi:hypothetical protein